MEVLILKGRNKAQDVNGTQYEIEGLEITRSETDKKIFYDKDTTFYKASCPDGIKSKSYLLANGKIMLY